MTISKVRIRKSIRSPRLVQFNLYLSKRMLRDIEVEAERLGKPIGWVIKKSWDLARPMIHELTPEDSK